MADTNTRPQIQTAELPVSKAKDEIIKEAKRIEESTLYSAKGHFVAARFWNNFHLWIGLPTVLLAGVTSASAFTQFDSYHIAAGLLALVIAALSSISTFLNPNEKAASHLRSGNEYDSLNNRVRIFWTIDCWREESDQVLTEKVKYFSEQKDVLNQKSPQIPGWAYKRAKRGILAGEADFKVDVK